MNPDKSRLQPHALSDPASPFRRPSAQEPAPEPAPKTASHPHSAGISPASPLLPPRNHIERTDIMLMERCSHSTAGLLLADFIKWLEMRYNWRMGQSMLLRHWCEFRGQDLEHWMQHLPARPLTVRQVTRLLTEAK